MSRTIRKTWSVAGVLADVTTATLSDSTNTYSIVRSDTGTNVAGISVGTAIPKVSTGVYEYTFTEPSSTITYTAHVKIVYDGQTYYSTIEIPAGTTTNSVLTITYDDLRREIGRFLGYGRDPSEWAGSSDEAIDVDDILKAGIRRVITPSPLPGEKYAHEWSFLRPTTTLTTTAPYATGTVAIASGVVTLSGAGAAFPSWASQGHLTVSSGTYAVASRQSNSQITLADTSVTLAAGVTYSLGRTAYDLPTDFAMIEGPLVYAAGQSVFQRPIQRVSEHQLLNELTYELTGSYPRRYAVRPKAINMSAATAHELLLAPTPDAAYALYYKYRVSIPALDSTTNTTPPGGDAHAELYLEACLAAAEQKLHDTAGLHTARFVECLVASVSQDRRAACPDTLGVMRDWSDTPGFDPNDHFWTQPMTTTYTARDGTPYP